MKNSTISRRGFLATALAASAGPLIIPSRALGRDGAVAPSERITMGFIGLGGQGSGHLFGGSWTYVAGGYLGRKEVQVLGVCDVWPQKRESARDRVNNHYAQLAGAGSFRSCEAYLDFREMIARPDIDAVLMALPFHLHAPVAMMAAKNAVVAGSITGNMDIGDKLELLPTAKVVGDLRVGSLIIGEGAIFKGNCEMRQAAE